MMFGLAYIAVFVLGSFLPCSSVCIFNYLDQLVFLFFLAAILVNFYITKSKKIYSMALFIVAAFALYWLIQAVILALWLNHCSSPASGWCL
jgi:hypothetical protein